MRCGCTRSSWSLSVTGTYFCKARPEDQSRERTTGSERASPWHSPSLPLASVFFAAFLPSVLLLRAHGCPLVVLFPTPLILCSLLFSLLTIFVSCLLFSSLTLYEPLPSSFTLNIFLQLSFHTEMSIGGLSSQIFP